MFYDRSGKRTGGLGERALYGETVLSPDRSRVAVVIQDLANESADLFVLDAASGAKTRLTTSARTEFVMAPVWSPDGRRIAYVTIRKGQEGIYVRAASGEGSEELLYRNPGAFMNLSDWSSDGRFLSFAISDLKGGTLYVLPLDGGRDRTPVEVFHSDLRLFGQLFARRTFPVLHRRRSGESDGSVCPTRRFGDDGRALADLGRQLQHRILAARRHGLSHLARDQSIVVARVKTSPSFSFSDRRCFFRQPSAVPERMACVSADGERSRLPPRAQLQPSRSSISGAGRAESGWRPGCKPAVLLP